MHLFHKWGPWSEPYQVPCYFVQDSDPYWETRQQRMCQTCNKLEARWVKS